MVQHQHGCHSEQLWLCNKRQHLCMVARSGGAGALRQSDPGLKQKTVTANRQLRRLLLPCSWHLDMSVYSCFPPYLSLISCIASSLVAPWQQWLQTPGLPSIQLHGVAAILTVTRLYNNIENFVEMTHDKSAVTDTCISCKCLSHLDSFDTLRL